MYPEEALEVAVVPVPPPAEYQSLVVLAAAGTGAGAAQLELFVAAVVGFAGDPQSSQVSSEFAVVAAVPATDVDAGTAGDLA